MKIYMARYVIILLTILAFSLINCQEFEIPTDKYYMIKNASTGLCLGHDGTTYLKQLNCDDVNQSVYWSFSSFTKDNSRYIKFRHLNGNFMELASSGDSNYVWLRSENSSLNQSFKLNGGFGKWIFRNESSGRCLTSDSTAGAVISQTNCTYKINQIWEIIRILRPVDVWVQVVSKLSNRCLSAWNYSSYVKTQPCNVSDAAQHFVFNILVSVFTE